MLVPGASICQRFPLWYAIVSTLFTAPTGITPSIQDGTEIPVSHSVALYCPVAFGQFPVDAITVMLFVIAAHIEDFSGAELQ